MSAYLKDIIREIKNTKGRFLSLLIITALGAASVVGILATSIDMRNVADKLYKERNLYDIQIKSTTGFDESDITALRNAEGVRSVMPSYIFDVYVYSENSTQAVRTYSIPDELNKIELSEGRLPENAGECVVEQDLLRSGKYNIGDTLSLGLDDMTEYHNALEMSSPVIVGVISSPLYINAHERGNTALGNGTLEFYLYLHPSAYVFDVYTDVYIQMQDSVSMDNLSDSYNNTAAEWRDSIKFIGIDRIQIKESELADAQKEIDDGFGEYYDGINELETKVAENREALNEAKTTLGNAKIELEESQNALEAYRGILPAEQLDAMQAGIDSGWTEYYNSFAEYESGVAALQTEESDALEKLSEARRELEEAEAKLADVPTPEWFYFTRKDGGAFDSYYQDTLRLEKIGYVFPLVFFLVAIMVSLTTMTRMVEEHRTQIGVYKALGYGTFRIMAKYLIYAFSAGIIGGVSGIFAGSYVFPKIITDAYSHMYDMPSVDTPVPLFIGIVAVAAAVGSVALVTLLTCTKTSSDVPALLMRPKPPQSGKRVLIERVPFIWNRLGFIGKVTARNIFRYKKRFIMTLVGVAGCSALLLTAFGLRDSIGGVAALQYDRVVEYDMRAYLKEITSEGQRGELDLSIAGECLYIREESVKMSGDGDSLDVSLVVPETPERLNEFINLNSPASGKTLTLEADGVVITEKLARKTGVSVNGSITITADGRTYTSHVSGITENYILNYIYMPPEVYKDLFGSEAVLNSVFIHSDNNSELSQTLLSNENVRAVINMNDQRASVSNSTDALGIVTIVLIILACALALVVLFNLTNINITERIRELATIKVLGFYDTELAMYIYRENAAVTIMGILAGLIGGVLLHRFVLVSIEVDILMFPLIIKPLSYVMAIVLSATFAVFVNLIMNKKLAAIDMVGALKNIE